MFCLFLYLRCSTALFWIVVKGRGLLNMGFGPVLFLCLFGVVTLGVFFYSLVNISKRSAMKDERLINKKSMQFIKKELN